MATLDLLRHARTAWNDLGRMQGRRDVPLSAAGRAEATAWRIPDGGKVRWQASPLARARETATLMGATPLEIEPALIEMDWGEWEGATLAELRTRHGDAYAANARRGLDFRPPGGESPRDVIARLEPWIASLAGRDDRTVAVAHNGVLRALVALATGWDMQSKPPKLHPACAHRFAIDARGRPTLIRCNIALAVPHVDRRL
jgi:probable phosphoglycerate mutase